MDVIEWEERPSLRRPLLMAAFEGWNDAGEAASSAVSHLADAWSARRFAFIDPEEYYDFTAVRPRVALDEDLTRRIEWPTNEFMAAELPECPHDVVIMAGTEPSLRWKTFAGAVVDLAVELKVEMVVTLGALLADVPHTRPVRVTGTAADPRLAERLHLSRSRYEGPTGILGVLGERFRDVGIPLASLWAAVPHYVGQTTSPKAALALVERASTLVGLPVRTVDLEIAAASYERQVNEVVASDPEVSEYVSRLERAEDEPDDDDDELPSADALADEVERFLRDHEE